MSTNNIFINKTTTIVLAFILLVCCWQAIKMGKANLSFYPAYQLTERWLKNNSLTDIVQYKDALKSIDDASMNHPNNPHYLIIQGLVREWGAVSNVFSDELIKKKQLKSAREYYLSAVELRPTWPVTWATLAILKWRLEEIDQQLIDYLIQADKYGPNTLEVHQAWLEIGLYLYRNKSPHTVKVIKGTRKHLELMLKDIRPSVRESAVMIIKRQNAQRFACNWILNYTFDTSWAQKNLCN
jgi:tetratricopeptide (TPR) repeat protein